VCSTDIAALAIYLNTNTAVTEATFDEPAAMCHILVERPRRWPPQLGIALRMWPLRHG
jgi:hypothetical protein